MADSAQIQPVRGGEIRRFGPGRNLYSFLLNLLFKSSHLGLRQAWGRFGRFVNVNVNVYVHAKGKEIFGRPSHRDVIDKPLYQDCIGKP